MTKKKNRKKLLYKNRYLYAMMFFPVVYFVLFKYKPMYGILIAFKNFKVREGILGSQWAGLKYFKQFWSDPDFWTAFKNTIMLSFWQILICFPVPILFALLVNEIRWGKLKGLVQRVCCFPHDDISLKRWFSEPDCCESGWNCKILYVGFCLVSSTICDF